MLLSKLPVGIAQLAYLSLFVAPVAATTQSYLLDTSYSGNDFFNLWNFFTDSDPTHGFVSYQSQANAAAQGLISAANGVAYLGVDYSTTLSSTSSVGRNSVRITSQKAWTHGLFVADIAHQPGSICGTWPACKSDGILGLEHWLTIYSLDVRPKLAKFRRNRHN